MDGSDRTMQSTDHKQFLLTQLSTEQKKYHEGSFEWADIQAKIDQIVAERYLEYVNR
jgi:hypothetical protein